jgi:adenylate cyclase
MQPSAHPQNPSRLSRGLEFLQRALDIDPSNAQAQVATGAAWGIQGRLDESIAKMRYGMQISPRDKRLGFWGWALGCILLKSGDVDAALAEARFSAGRDPRLHLSRLLEAAALCRLGRFAEARAALGTARRLRPSLRLDEVESSHGRRMAAELAKIWSAE